MIALSFNYELQITNYELLQVEPLGIEPKACSCPFVGFRAVEHQSRPQ
ncbi:hypothetical protein FDUTEX481_02939 [Tolypothrix sp. PCC 7601]|nr:hypothetical protein FDUTEX481_02939 [Tolypothrix sp. PCC 7601]